MNFVIGSAFRNASGNVERYFSRVFALRETLKPWASLRVVAVEGDSTDDTRLKLGRVARDRGLDLDLILCDHGGPEFGSTEAPERLKALSRVGNAIFGGVRAFDDVLIYVEQDLQWDPETMVQLCRAALGKLHGFDVFAPLVMAGDCFYDIWGFRGIDGRRFSPFPGYYPGMDGVPFEIGSAGSCLVMEGNIARHTRIEDDNCLVGWCASARRSGYRIAVVPTLAVRQA